MSYFPPAVRPRRRRRVLIVLSVLTIVVVAVAFAMERGNDERALDRYLEVVREASAAYSALATDVQGIVTGLEKIERSVMIGRLEDAIVAASEADALLQEAEVPASVGGLAGFAVAASSSWREGITGIHAALLILLDEPTDPQGSALLEQALLDLEVGDRAYEHFQAAIQEFEAQEDVSPRITAGVHFVAASDAAAYDAALMTGRIAALRELSARHDMAVSSVRFDPEAAGEREGIPVVPFSPTFQVQVTVTNRGNEPEQAIPVSLVLIQSDGSLPPFTDSRTVEALNPGEATTLTFDRLPVVAGEFHEIVVRAELDGDDDPTSNEFRQVFYRNDST